MLEELQAVLDADLGPARDAARLAEILYERCYVRRLGEPVPEETGEDLTAALAAANQSREGWDFGWRADQAIDEGRVLARKGGAARTFRAGQYITLRGPTGKVDEGEPIRVFTAAGADLQAGFYHVFGETVSAFDDFEDVLRFYWNVPAASAGRLMELVTGAFNRWQTPFLFKCGRSTSMCTRRDAAVLYVQRPYLRMAQQLAGRIHDEIGSQLRDDVPLFTLRLARGLGYAEDPSGSFGKHRCAILAEAMLEARTVESVRGQFEKHGLSLETPWRNAGTAGECQIKRPAGGPAADRGVRRTWLEAAERIGARLCRDALWSGGRCNWTADRVNGDHGALGPRLYSGTSGIALFLWRLAEVTGEPIFRETAEGALGQALSKLPVGGCGFYTGEVGIRFVESIIRGEADWSGVAEPNANDLDVIAGSAGAIPVLLRAGQSELALRHGESLLREAHRVTLTGFSHGKAGIGAAFVELFGSTGDVRYRDAALEAFRCERGRFDADDREDKPAEQAMVWCHGAGGIAFSRLRAWQILGDAEMLAEARTALAMARDVIPRLVNFSLCHGVAGNADLLIYASEVLGESEWRVTAEEAAEGGLEKFERRRVLWPSGMIGTSETPDLMWGLAGIGYFYLRLGAPVPTVLLP